VLGPSGRREAEVAMGWSRMRTMLRYKHVFRRVGFMNCMLLLLFTIVVFTYPGGPGHFFRKVSLLID